MISIFTQRNRAGIKARLYQLNKSWKTKRKIVVFESDDWGGIRTSDIKSYNQLKSLGYNVDKSPYMLDALETNTDLTSLFEILSKHKNNLNVNPKFTANIITANPDFEKIEEENFKTYSYKSVEKTCSESEQSNNVIQLWNEGFKNELFTPQIHGREHVKYWEWMKRLQNQDEETRLTFNMKMCGVPLAVSKQNISFFKPLYIDDTILKQNRVDIEQLINEGNELFQNIFGFKSISTVAPNVAWTNTTEKIWKKGGINFIQGGFLQEIHKSNETQYIPRYLGEKNNLNQTYLVRNCTFEPCRSSNTEYWRNTFNEIKRAFLLNTPAIISTHRVNYIGAIKESNRSHGLKQLDFLFEEILSKYPNVEFMSSDELGELINK